MLGAAAAPEEGPSSGNGGDAEGGRGDENAAQTGPVCPVCKAGWMLRGLELPRPSVAELLAIPGPELFAGPRLVQQQFS